MRALGFLLLLTSLAGAEPVTLRLAAIAPDGTSWARELKAFARGVETDSHGAVKIKWYLGGIAGDEYAALERVDRGQLDGAAGGLMCEALAPVLKVMRVPGLIQTREAATHVLNALQPEVTAEMAKRGYVFLGAAGFGLDVLFSRTPINSMTELKRQRLWLRAHDDVLAGSLRAVGAQTAELPYEDTLHAYEEGRIDGFVATPASALAFQWAGLVHAYTDVKLAYMTGCVAFSKRAMDKLPIERQKEIQNQAALLALRFEQVGRDFDHQLLDRIFATHGLARVTVSEAFRKELFARLAEARARIDDKVVPHALVERVARIVSTTEDKPR